MSERPLVIQYQDDGREYGVADADAAKRLHPDATIVRYQDGSPFVAPDPEPAEGPAPAPKASKAKGATK